jgi:hypothetical protein
MVLAKKLKWPVHGWVPFTKEGVQSLLPCRHLAYASSPKAYLMRRKLEVQTKSRINRV